MYYDLSFFTLYDRHVVLRRTIPSHFLYYDVLGPICSTKIGYLMGGLWGKPHDSWCAPLTPHCIFIFPSYEMIVAETKWLERHLLFSGLMQARTALRWFHWWNYGPLSSCLMTTCFHCILLPCIADICTFMRSIIWSVLEVVEQPIGSMILPTLYVVHFRRNHGQTMNATSYFFSSCGRDHLENLRRHFMVGLFDEV